jgi:hypothetical protein
VLHYALRINLTQAKESIIFPKTFGTVTMIVGAIWIVQGAGLAPTGSFMDGQPIWAVLGAALFGVGLISVLAQRRRARRSGPSQPES